MTSLRGRLGLQHKLHARRKNPYRCALCRLLGHDWRNCQIRRRLEELGLPRWLRGFNA